MEITVLESSAKKALLEVKGEDTTFCNVMVKELWKNKHVKNAAFRIEHPLISSPVILVETDGDETVQKVLASAANSLVKKNESFRKDFKAIRM